MIKIAIQGIKGCFHEIAAYKFFGERQALQTIECHSFEQMFRAFKQDEQIFGVMAIENTVAGSILPNYSKLMLSDMQIIGEVYLRIEQNLLALPDVKLEDITEVRSHPMALLQCLSFFEKHPQIKLTETADTALSAKELSENPSNKNTGAIASFLAADRYKLNVLAEGIETNKRNFTRFLVLQNKNTLEQNDQIVNKSSIWFKTGHTPGSLAAVLGIFAKNNINLTKIQSLPVIGREWEYLFLVDLEFGELEDFNIALNQSDEFISELHLLGKYQKGIKFRTV